MSKRIIIDITEFNSWSGHLTGIQRVIAGFAEASHKNINNTALITYVPSEKTFTEVQFEQFNKIINSSTREDNVVTIESTTQNVKRIVKKIYHRSPRFVKAWLTESRRARLKAVAKRTYHAAKNLHSGKLTKLVDVKQNINKFVFMPGDVVISAGRTWDDDSQLDAFNVIQKKKHVKIAYVVYDLIPIYQQHTFGLGLTDRFTSYLYRILKEGDYLFAISHSTKHDLEYFAEEIGLLDVPKINTIRLGDDIANSDEDRPGFISEGDDFTMTVGTIEARKNHTEIYYAYKLAKERHVKLPKMYIIGKPGWLTNDLIYFIEHDNDTKDKLEIVHNVSDSELAWMYRHALFTVYPSQYEGWGLPIAESICFGTPCIASSASSTGEVASEYVDHVSSFDSAQLLEKMHYYTDRKNSDKKKQQLKAYKPHTWVASIREIVDKL